MDKEQDKNFLLGNLMITIEKLMDNKFRVTVNKTKTTEHEVGVSTEYYEKLTNGYVPVEVLIEKSFLLLLERESNTSILSSFDLPIIGRYFPEYESIIKDELLT